MKLSIEQEKLSSLLQQLNRIVPARPSHPILANILIKAFSEKLSLTSFDLSIGLELETDAHIMKEGETTIPARLFLNIVTKLPSQDVVVSSKKDRITIECGTGEYFLQGLPASEFPDLPHLDSKAIDLNPTQWSEGLQKTLFSVSHQESKPILTALHISGAEGLEFASTDGHRLSVASFPDVPSSPLAVNIPAKALQMLSKSLDGAESVQLRANEITAEFILPGMRITSRLIDGQFPAYPQLIPNQFSGQLQVERLAFIATLERVAVLAEQMNNLVKLSINGNMMTVSAEAEEFGSGTEQIVVQASGIEENFTISFNVKYKIDGLKAIKTDFVTLFVNSATSPAVIRPVEGKTDYSYLVMPVQIRE